MLWIGAISCAFAPLAVFLIEVFRGRRIEERFLPRLGPNRYKVWLTLHATYQIWALVDVIPAILAVVAVYLMLPSSTLQLQVLAISPFVFIAVVFYFFSFVYRSSFLNLLGQHYHLTDTASEVGVKSLALLSGSLLRNEKPAGLKYLRMSIRIGGDVLAQRNLFSERIDRTKLALRVLRSHPAIPFLELRHLSEGIFGLPKLEDLPGVLQSTLEHLGWPLDFEVPTHWRRYLRFRIDAVLLVIIGFLTLTVTAVIAVVNFLPKPVVENLFTYVTSPIAEAIVFSMPLPLFSRSLLSQLWVVLSSRSSDHRT